MSHREGKLEKTRWRIIPIIPKLGKLRQKDFHQFEVCLDDIVRSRAAWVTV